MLPQAEIKKIFADAQAIITGDHFVYAKKADGEYHGPDYVNKDAIYPFVNRVSDLCKEIARHFLERKYFADGTDGRIDVVVGPTVGAVSLAQWTARWFDYEFGHLVLAICADEEDVLEPRKIFKEMQAPWKEEFSFSASGKVEIKRSATGNLEVVFTEKVGTRRVIKRGYGKHVKGKRCLIVEDVINSGATVAKTRDAILQMGGEVAGVGCLCNRSGGKVTSTALCVPELFSLLDVDMEMFKEETCPICREKGRGSVRLDLGKGKEFLARIGINPGNK